MPRKIIQEPDFIIEASHNLNYWNVTGTGGGYGFTCDEHGHADESKLGVLSIGNLQALRAGTIPNMPREGTIERRESHYKQCLVIECDCGRANVECGHFTNTCDECGRDYNMSGQLLADRSQWGEETGESLGDILSIS